MALVLPATHAYPAVHAPEQVALLTPAVDPYCPAGHKPVHDAVVRPVVFPYRPALQLVHTADRLTLYVPTGHSSAVALVLPAAHAYPAVQLPLHAAVAAPGVAPNVPPGHNVQALAPAKLY